MIVYAALPRITFTSPQIAAVGLTDEQAKAQGLDCFCRTLPLEHVPRALVERDTRGLVKLVVEWATRRVVGATVVSEGAGDVILAGVYAVQFGLTLDQITETWAPYLTMSKGFKLAAQTFDSDVAHSPAARHERPRPSESASGRAVRRRRARRRAGRRGCDRDPSPTPGCE
ncbi:MAG: hypothetical protein ABR583_08375 [Gaiellaceae bacterium]